METLITVGMDLGDRDHITAVFDADGAEAQSDFLKAVKPVLI